MNGPGSMQAGSPLSDSSLSRSVSRSKLSGLRGQEGDFWVFRLALFSASCPLCFALPPFNLHGLPAVGLGFFIAMVILLAELRLRHAEISGLVGGAVGTVIGLLAALLITLVISRTSQSDSTKSFLEFISLLSLAYLGLVLGSRKGPDFRGLLLSKPVE